jgi:hypothetical protein
LKRYVAKAHGQRKTRWYLPALRSLHGSPLAQTYLKLSKDLIVFVQCTIIGLIGMNFFLTLLAIGTVGCSLLVGFEGRPAMRQVPVKEMCEN